jgi:hypothetical protein
MTISLYKPEADTNGDGLPEGAPFFTIPSFVGILTRVLLAQ